MTKCRGNCGNMGDWRNWLWWWNSNRSGSDVYTRVSPFAGVFSSIATATAISLIFSSMLMSYQD